MTTLAQPAPAIELVSLGTMSGTLRTPFVLKETPAGTRLIYEVASGRLEGRRVSASLHGQANADWLTVGPDGVGTLDVRMLVRTDDGALILMQYHGRLGTGPAGETIVYSAPRFETGDDRYRWMNGIQAVGKGILDGTTLTYELYEVR